MRPAESRSLLERAKEHISAKVRELRTERRWTQRDLAQHLGLSQSRLSEIERGAGSFSAEQLLVILHLFQVDVSAFDISPPDRSGALQNALIRLGATHLRQVSDAQVTSEFAEPAVVVSEVLQEPVSARHLTALAPVLVRQADAISLARIQGQLSAVGRPNRLAWLADNVVEALEHSTAKQAPLSWRRQAARASVVLGEFVLRIGPLLQPPGHPGPRDILDPDLRSPLSIERTWERGSETSRQWNIVSALTPSDFADALHQATSP